MDISIKSKKNNTIEKNNSFCVENTEIVIKMLPYIVSFVMLLQIPLQILLVDNIHIYITALAILFLLVEFALGGFRIKCWKVFSLILFVLCWIVLSGFMLPSILIPALGAFDYLLPIFFWSLYFNRFINCFNVSNFCQFLIKIGVLMALFGIYQSIIDPSLFGVMSEINLYYNKSTLEHVSVFRISSFFSSTQVFSFYIGMCVALLLDLWENINLKYLFKWCMLVIMLIGGLMAGGKIFILLSGMSLFFYIFKNLSWSFFKVKIYNLCLLFFVILVFFVVFIFYYNNILVILNSFLSALNRIFLFFSARDNFLKEEVARLNIIIQIFSLDLRNILLGHGLGTASYSAFNTLGDKYLFSRFTSESYVISWWYEMGVFGIIFFIIFFGGIIVSAFEKKIITNKTILCLLIAMFFVPTFYSVSMLPAWGILLFPYYYSPNEFF